MELGIRDFHLPLLFTAIILGYELAVYFSLLYKKAKNENLELNKILLSYAFFFGILWTGQLMRMLNHYYIYDNPLIELFNKLPIFLGSLSVAIFLLLNKPIISKIVSSKFLLLIILLMLLHNIIAILFYEINSPMFLVGSIFLMISLFYVAGFQTKILSHATGSVKKRLKIILFGELILIAGLFIGRDDMIFFLFQEIFDISSIVGVFLLILGTMIIFFGVYRFPAFLEFDWKKSLLMLYIINNNNFKPLFIYDFTSKIETTQKRIKKDQLFPGGIIGIDSVISTITNQAKKSINKIHHSDLYFYIEHSDEPVDYITYVLLVKKDLKSFNFFIQLIKKQFQSFYSEILIDLEKYKNQFEFFSSFDVILNDILAES